MKGSTDAPSPLLGLSSLLPSPGPWGHTDSARQPPAPVCWEPGARAPAKAGPSSTGMAQPGVRCCAKQPASPDRWQSRVAIHHSRKWPTPLLVPQTNGSTPPFPPLVPPSTTPARQPGGAVYTASPECGMGVGGGRAEQHTETHPSSLRASSSLHTAVQRVPGHAGVCVCVCVCTCMPSTALSAQQSSIGLVLTRKGRVCLHQGLCVASALA